MAIQGKNSYELAKRVFGDSILSQKFLIIIITILKTLLFLLAILAGLVKEDLRYGFLLSNTKRD